ncbi:MAG: DUF4923 family protein [Clostridium sp.]|nr:DUF4923 family protein [Prevotella sp.]MCM1428294.1 DUF4923 family protein [Clostridium sp.]MCM1474766.1 DUF4923 family protein [Muribaculaceae bacterium]
MKNIVFCLFALSALFFPSSSYAWSIKDALSGLKESSSGNVLGGILEGVLTKTDISVSEFAGEWTADGSAVSFKSENALAKAGGVAASAAIEAKLDPYFKQYGLTGAVFTFSEDGSFTLKVKKMTLTGTVTKNDDKSFEFTFNAFGGRKIGSLTAYVQKSPSNLEIMFDATKLKSLISTIATFSGMEMAKTAAKLLDQYDGLCVGFSLSKTGNAPNASNESNQSTPSLLNLFKNPSTPSTPSNQDAQGNSSSMSSGFGMLLKMFSGAMNKVSN